MSDENSLGAIGEFRKAMERAKERTSPVRETGKLREILTARGVAYETVYDDDSYWGTQWIANGLTYRAFERNAGSLIVAAAGHDLTAQEAVKATLGNEARAKRAEKKDPVCKAMEIKVDAKMHVDWESMASEFEKAARMLRELQETAN